jgi:cobalamin synthase
VVVGMVPLMGAFAAMWLGFRVTGLAVAMFGLVVAFAMPHVLARRFGGVNGDVMGASVLITEALLLAAMAVIP